MPLKYIPTHEKILQNIRKCFSKMETYRCPTPATSIKSMCIQASFRVCLLLSMRFLAAGDI